MGNLAQSISGVVDVVDILGLIQFSMPKPHSLHEVGVYEVVGGS